MQIAIKITASHNLCRFLWLKPRLTALHLNWHIICHKCLARPWLRDQLSSSRRCKPLNRWIRHRVSSDVAAAGNNSNNSLGISTCMIICKVRNNIWRHRNENKVLKSWIAPKIQNLCRSNFVVVHTANVSTTMCAIQIIAVDNSKIYKKTQVTSEITHSLRLQSIRSRPRNLISNAREPTTSLRFKKSLK